MTLISISALQKQEVRSVASLQAVHWDVRWLNNSKGCCYHPPLCELVSSQRQGNPRCSAHFKRRAVWKNNIVRMRGASLPPPSAFWNKAERYGTEPVDKFGQTAERLHKERFVCQDKYVTFLKIIFYTFTTNTETNIYWIFSSTDTCQTYWINTKHAMFTKLIWKKDSPE